MTQPDTRASTAGKERAPLKSDAKDARVIRDLAVEGKWVTFSLRDGAYAELKGWPSTDSSRFGSRPHSSIGRER
jgi:hypothetical protein